MSTYIPGNRPSYDHFLELLKEMGKQQEEIKQGGGMYQRGGLVKPQEALYRPEDADPSNSPHPGS